MAYGNYQNGYQMPIYGQQVYPQMQAQQPQQPQNGIQWVQGEAGAKSYLVAAGNTVMLMDSETQRDHPRTRGEKACEYSFGVK